MVTRVTYFLFQISFSAFTMTVCILLQLSEVLLTEVGRIDFGKSELLSSDDDASEDPQDANLIWDSINFNALAYFLLSNILTGLVNLFFSPRTTDALPAVLVLSLYVLVLVMSVVFLYSRKVKLKIPYT